MFSRFIVGFNISKHFAIVGLFVMTLPILANDTNHISNRYEDDMLLSAQDPQPSNDQEVTEEELRLGPVIIGTHPQSVTRRLLPILPSDSASSRQSILGVNKPWAPIIAPFLNPPFKSEGVSDSEQDSQYNQEKIKAIPAKILAVDVHPKMAKIAILIDDLGYNRRGMESSLVLPVEVALAILPGTPFARQTALSAQKQNRITLLHAPMENQRELELGPGGLYANMTEHELKATLKNNLDGLPGIQGVNNHMGSLLTTKSDSMTWVMETLKNRSLFFIDSLTSPKSVAKKTAQEHGLKTVSRDVFLDNIRTEKAIDKQFSHLVKLARRHGSVLAIGHPYPATMDYLKKRLKNLEKEGIRLVPLSEILLSPSVEPTT